MHFIPINQSYIQIIVNLASRIKQNSIQITVNLGSRFKQEKGHVIFWLLVRLVKSQNNLIGI